MVTSSFTQNSITRTAHRSEHAHAQVPTVCQMLRHYVNNDLCKEEKPSCSDRAYYPTKDDIKNHVYRAKKAFELSKFDQHNLELKLKALKDDTSDNSSMYMFRPFKHRAELEELQASDSTEFEQTLLWIHQEKWQQELLQFYGNDICLIDATYKTTKYELPLFFVCVRTNVGYSAIAQFIVQQEGTRTVESHVETKIFYVRLFQGRNRGHLQCFSCYYNLLV